MKPTAPAAPIFLLAAFSVGLLFGVDLVIVAPKSPPVPTLFCPPADTEEDLQDCPEPFLTWDQVLALGQMEYNRAQRKSADARKLEL